MSIAHPAKLGHLAIFVGLLVGVAHATDAFAQGAPPAGGGNPANPGGPLSGGAPAGGTTGGGVTISTSTVTGFPGGVAPPPAGGTLGGGNAQFSSSKPITGNERDTFDFRQGGGGAATAHGNENSSFVLGNGGESRAVVGVPDVHQVRKGDTLWDICDHYFRNPYQWPRIWSYNPQVQNPHWIFPGDQVHLRSAGAPGATVAATPAGGGSRLIDGRRQVPPETIFLRNEGYIDEEVNNWGEITGSPEDKMILTENDEIYLRIGGSYDVKIGQELTIYRPVRNVASGKLIAIQGTAKVDEWNAKERIARAKITEALDAIERGARVGPVARRFEVVPPLRNEKDISAKVLTSVKPHNLFGQNQAVFVDQGQEAGLKPGNRLFVIRKGDAWHQTLTTGSSDKRIALEDDSPAATERVPRPRDASSLPDEVLAELRVISVRKNSALCLVTASRREIEPGDAAFSRKGY